MNKIVVCALAATSLVSMNSFAEEITWENLPVLVRERNGRVSSMHEKAKAAEALTGHALRSFQPKIEAFGGYERGDQGRDRSHYRDSFYGIEGRMNLFASGRDAKEAEIRDARAKYAEGAARLSESEVLFEARRLYLEWLVSDELAQAHRTAMQENEKGAKAANRRISRGVGTTTDRIEFELHEKELSQAFESLEHEKLILQILIAGILRFEDPKKLILKGTLEHFHDEPLLGDLSTVIAGSPVLVLADASSSEANALSAQRHRWWAPSVDLYAGHHLYPFREREYSDRRERNESVLGVELRFTLWDVSSRVEARSQGFNDEASNGPTSEGCWPRFTGWGGPK